MLDKHQLEGLRRSAAMGPLTPAAVVELLESCIETSRRHERISGVLADLPSSWAGVKSALNELHRLVSE